MPSGIAPIKGGNDNIKKKMAKKFDTNKADAQSTTVEPLKPEHFDFEEYAVYASELDQRCKAFEEKESGVLVYRRMRVAECFSYGCKDMEWSLNAQLGALKASMDYKADVANFLEPWYGIGTIASAYGGDYVWHPGQAPALQARFKNLDEALSFDPFPVKETRIGKFTLEMIGYFLEKTKGRLPMSFTDTQSPLNMIGHLLPVDDFLLQTITAPDNVLKFLDVLADLSIDFNKEQHKLIGDALASPGHGFASSRTWKGLGMSDDNILMISPEDYLRLASPSVVKICNEMGGPVFHSCGNWEPWLEAVLQIPALLMADGAFSPETDPGAIEKLEPFHAFANTGIVLNARIVGDLDTLTERVKRLWAPGMKLIVVTYCQSPEEQAEAYDRIHEICN
jgi:uroporphyrinogen-III decarboxylase